MSFLDTNIKFLRKARLFTQADLAARIGVKRSVIGAYEEHRSEPKIDTFQKMAYLFEVSLDQLINQDLSRGLHSNQTDIEGRTLRILPIAIDQHNREMISIVPVSARAGYTHGYADPEFIKDLPKFTLPLPEIHPDKSYRVFQIEGDSMIPVPDGSYIICEYVENWTNVKEGESHILITRNEGLLYKRIWREGSESQFLLKSDNIIYQSFSIALNDVVEIWRSLAFLSFDLPDADARASSDIQQLSDIVMQLQSDVEALTIRSQGTQ